MGIGLVPAAGAKLAAFASYSLTRRLARQPDCFGKGNPEGIVACESANNACSGGALMTTLVLDVPGSVTTAILLGALTIQVLKAGTAAHLRTGAAGLWPVRCRGAFGYLLKRDGYPAPALRRYPRPSRCG